MTNPLFPKKIIYSGNSKYYIKVKEELSIVCNENYTLCLKNGACYCIVYEDNFTIIYNNKYKIWEKKVCKEINITEELILSDTNLVDKLSNEQDLSDSIESTYKDNKSLYIDKLYDKSDILYFNHIFEVVRRKDIFSLRISS